MEVISPHRSFHSEMTNEMTIGQLARAAGVGIETIRFYQRRGLIRKPAKPAIGHRTYDETALLRLRFIRRAQDLGFSLAEIRELLELRVDPARDCSEVRAQARDKIADIDERLESLHRIKSVLEEITRSCSGEGSTAECPILDAIEGPVR